MKKKIMCERKRECMCVGRRERGIVRGRKRECMCVCGERERGGREEGRERWETDNDICTFKHTHTHTHKFKILPLFLTVQELNMNKSFIAEAGRA